MRPAVLLPILCLTPAACGDGSAAAPQAQGAKAEAVLRAVDRVAHPELDEGSGLVRWQGAWWLHEDSGAKPVLWRSESLDFARAEPFAVPDAVNLDWEDAAADGDTLLVADLGDNLRVRPGVTLYRVRFVPAAAGAPPRVERTATYPVAWPGEGRDARHDCEAVAVIDGKLHAVTKDRGEGTIVFRFGELRDGETNRPEEVARLDLGDREQVTSAVFDETSRSLVVLTYTQIARYPADRLSGAPADATWIGARQAEAVAIDGDDLVFTNEQRDVFRIERFRDWRFSRLLPPRVRVTVGAGDAELPLADAEAGESMRWRLEAGVLHVRAELRCAGEPRFADPAANKLGNGIVLAFGQEDRSHVSAAEALLAASLERDGAGAVHRVALSDRGLVLGPARSASAKVRREGERVVVEAEVPLEEAFERPPAAGGRFLFFVQGSGLGRDPPPHFGATDAFAFYRPYLWAEVSVAR